jgi:hypothetical protein
VVANFISAYRHLLAGAAAALVLGLGTAPARAADEGAAKGAATKGAAAAGDDSKVVGPPETKWDDMTKEQRGKYMKAVVTPKMKPVFQEFDPKMFAKFDCTSCHGKEAKAKKFKMPNPDLHPLPNTPAAFQAMMAKKPTWPKWVDFMAKKVEPQMAALLGMPAYDPKKPDPNAFGCKGCHTLNEGKE